MRKACCTIFLVSLLSSSLPPMVGALAVASAARECCVVCAALGLLGAAAAYECCGCGGTRECCGGPRCCSGWEAGLRLLLSSYWCKAESAWLTQDSDVHESAVVNRTHLWVACCPRGCCRTSLVVRGPHQCINAIARSLRAIHPWQQTNQRVQNRNG